MYSFQRFLEINNFIISNEIIDCEFFLLKKSHWEKKIISLDEKKKKIVIKLPFWIAKIFNISSFCQIIIPSCFYPQKMKNFFNESKDIGSEFFLGKFFFLGLKLKKIGYKKISKKIMKSLFLKRFYVFLGKIKEYFFSSKKNKIKHRNFEIMENLIFSNLVNL